MDKFAKLILLRLLPVLLITTAAAVYVVDVEGPGAFAARNAVPLIVLVALSALTLYRGGGSWIGAGWRWPLGTLGFAIPALGLSLYLHYAYSVELESLFAAARHPEQLFRYLPIYTVVAGGIGFAIGWIVGRNV
jgi:hypothetical protein